MPDLSGTHSHCPWFYPRALLKEVGTSLRLGDALPETFAHAFGNRHVIVAGDSTLRTVWFRAVGLARALSSERPELREAVRNSTSLVAFNRLIDLTCQRQDPDTCDFLGTRKPASGRGQRNGFQEATICHVAIDPFHLHAAASLKIAPRDALAVQECDNAFVYTTPPSMFWVTVVPTPAAQQPNFLSVLADDLDYDYKQDRKKVMPTAASSSPTTSLSPTPACTSVNSDTPAAHMGHVDARRTKQSSRAVLARAH